MSEHRITLTGLYWGNTIQNVVHVLNPDGALDAPGIFTEFTNNWINVIKAKQMNTFHWTSITEQIVDTAGIPPNTTALSIAGDGVGNEGLQSVLAVILSFRTSFAGRAGRGRIYIAGVKADAVETNVLRPSTFTDYQTIATTLTARFKSGGSGPLTLLVRKHSGAGALGHPVSDIICRNRWGVQRRRNTGVGI